MTARSTLRRLAILFILALMAPLPALAQIAVTQGRPTQSTPAQSTPSAAAPSQAPQAAPSQGAPSQQAALSQGAQAQSAPAPATAGPAYDVEVLIFRAQATLGQHENWAAETTTGATVAGGEASSGSGPAGRLLTVLPSSDYRLTYFASRLRSSGTYLPVAHAAWIQTASAWGTTPGFPSRPWESTCPDSPASSTWNAASSCT